MNLRRCRRRALRVLLLVALLGLAGCLRSTRLKVDAYSIPPGHEAAVLRFLEPMKDGGPVPGGLILRNIAIDRTFIRLEFADARGGAAALLPVELRHRSSFLGEGVDVSGAERLPAATVAAIRAAVDRPGNRLPWVKAAAPVSKEVGPAERNAVLTLIEPLRARAREALSDVRGELSAAPNAVRAHLARDPDQPGSVGTPEGIFLGPTLVFMNMIALFGATLLLALRLLSPSQTSARPRWVLPSFALLFALALALRLGLSPRTFLHEYYHIAESPRFLLDPVGYLPHGITGPVLYSLANACFGGDERAIFATNALLASLSIPAVIFFDLALFGRWPRALLAGLLVCLLPLHLRFSASEELWIPGILFTLWSLAAWLHFLATRSRLALGVAVLALALAVQCRSELMVLPAFHLLLCLALRPAALRWPTLPSRPLLAGAGLLLLLVSTRLGALLHLWKDAPKSSLPGLGALRAGTVLLDAEATAPLLLALAVLGSLYGLRRWPARYAWLLLLTAAYVVIPLSAFDNRPCIYRTQMFSVVLACVAAAGVPDLIAAFGRRRFTLPLAWGGCALLALAALWGGRAFVTEHFDQQQEFTFLESVVPRLPVRATLITLADAGGGRFDAFPEFLLERNVKDFTLHDLEARGVGDLRARPGRPLLFYQGMYCYFTQTAEPVDPMHKRCQAIRAHYAMKPLLVRTLHARGYSTMHYARKGQGPYEIGFFEITGLREPAPGGS